MQFHKTRKKSLPCKNCIDASKIEVEKLSEVLINDLAITKENIQVYFLVMKDFMFMCIIHNFKKSALERDQN
jgi:hypothetical protein